MKYQNITKYKDIFKDGYKAGNYVASNIKENEKIDKNVIIVPNLDMFSSFLTYHNNTLSRDL